MVRLRPLPYLSSRCAQGAARSLSAALARRPTSRFQVSTVRAVRWQAASFAGAPSPGLISPDPDADPAPQWAVPAPANDAALQLICFKYVAGAHDVRKLLSELHDVESGESDQEPVGWFAVDFVCRSAVGCAAQPVNPITADSAYVVSLLHSSRPHYCRRRPVQPVRRGQRSGRY